MGSSSPERARAQIWVAGRQGGVNWQPVSLLGTKASFSQVTFFSVFINSANGITSNNKPAGLELTQEIIMIRLIILSSGAVRGVIHGHVALLYSLIRLFFEVWCLSLIKSFCPHLPPSPHHISFFPFCISSSSILLHLFPIQVLCPSAFAIAHSSPNYLLQVCFSPINLPLLYTSYLSHLPSPLLPPRMY